jgi:hypothetical protein
MDADGVAVGDHDVEDDAVAAAVADDVDAGASPGGSDAVGVDVCVRVADGVGVPVGVGEALHCMKKVCVRPAVRLRANSVTFCASLTNNVLLMARVLHVLAMPAAVHAAGGGQHAVTCGLRLIKTTLLSSTGVIKSTSKNSRDPVPRL